MAAAATLLALLAALLPPGLAAALPGVAAPPRAIAAYRNIGGIEDGVVGPGPTAGSQRVYVTYIYFGRSFDLVIIDPQTGRYHVIPSPLRDEVAAVLDVGRDGAVYLATRPHAYLLRYTPATGRLMILGRPAPSEQYVWELTTGADGRIYGGTYPSADLVRYDPTSGRLANLGRMDAAQLYARYVAASRDSFIYAGIGYAQAHLVAYQIATGRHRDILPPADRVKGVVQVYQGRDGRVYAHAGAAYFVLSGWTLRPVAAAQAVAAPRTQLRDGRSVTVEHGLIAVRNPATGQIARHPYAYRGEPMGLFRLGAGPDGRLYGSSALPFYLVRIDPHRGGYATVGDLGGGEAYTLLAHGGRLLLGAYGASAPLMEYNPGAAVALGTTPGSNPREVHYAGDDDSWRPGAMIAAPDGRIYIGSQNGYGVPGGALTIWNPATGAIQVVDQPVAGESVTALTWAGGYVVGGTSISGGSGTLPTRSSAELFMWNPGTRRVAYAALLPGEPTVTALATARNGRVYGAVGDRFVVFTPRRFALSHPYPLPCGSLVADSLAPGPDGRLWGLCTQGIVAIDPATDRATLVAVAPQPITAGFALWGGALYYASGPTVYRYDLP